MQNSSTALKQVLAEQTSATALPYVRAEFNVNRHADGLTVVGSDHDPERFPIASVAEPNRPISGLPKFILGQSRLGEARLASEDAIYKYYISPSISSGGGAVTAGVQIIYDKQYSVNKIRFVAEQSDAVTNAVDIYTTFNGTTWTRVAQNAVPNAVTGVLELYFAGSWSQTENYAANTLVRGIRVEVRTVNTASRNAGIIELSAWLCQDISDRVTSLDIDSSREEQSVYLPYGISQANSMSLSLENSDSAFNPHNAVSIYKEFIDQDAEFVVGYGIKVGSSFEYIQKGRFYADNWGLDDSIEVTVTGTDFVKFLQRIQMNEIFYEDMRPRAIIKDVLAMAGVPNYVFRKGLDEKEYSIPFVWFDSGTTVWSALTEIAKIDSAAIYVDETETIIYETMQHVMDQASNDFVVRYNASGATLPNLIDMSTDFSVATNQAIVPYSPLKPNLDSAGEPYPDYLWRPEGTLTLEASPLEHTMTAGQNYFIVPERYAAFWPYSGLVDIEGEIIEYDGKEAYRDGVYVKKDAFDEYPVEDGWKETGRFYIVERGARGTEAKEHRVDIDGWGKVGVRRLSYRDSDAGILFAYTPPSSSQKWVDGKMRLKQGANADERMWLQSFRGVDTDQYKTYSTKLNFNEVTKDGMAGLMLHRKSNNSAYFVELVLSTTSANRGGTIGNIRCYYMASDGTRQGLPSSAEGTKGYDFPVVPGIDFQVDVTYEPATFAFNVYLNGQFVTTFNDSRNQTGQWGLFARGHTNVDFEYFAASEIKQTISLTDSWVRDSVASSYINSLPGSYTPVTRPREDGGNLGGSYSTAVPGFNSSFNVSSIQHATTIAGYKSFYDEFGPVVREVREFDIDYNLKPALSAHLFVSNPNALVLNFAAGHFGAEMILMNSERVSIVLQGEGSDGYGNTINEAIWIYGQPVVMDAQTEETVKNIDSIRKRGLIEVTISSAWIQTRDQALKAAETITENWSEPLDNLTVQIWPYIILEPGDQVGIVHPKHHMTDVTHRYNILQSSLSFSDGGLTQTLRLRRNRS